MSHGIGIFSDFEECSSPDDAAGRPKYERLRDRIVAEIESGGLLPGAALPSEHRLAEVLKIARSTVRQTLASLERDGFVRRVHGKGTFVHEQARLRLRPGRDLFALVVPETQAGFYPSLQRSFEEAAAELHHQVIVCNSNNSTDRQGNSILQLIDHRVAGVAIVPATEPQSPAFQLKQLQKQGIPVVCCSRRMEGVSAPLLAIPFEEVGRRAGQAVFEAGHRRVAYFAAMRSTASLAYERGFRSCFPASGDAPARISAFYGAAYSPDAMAHEDEVGEIIDSLFEGGDGPTAIFASFDSLAELFYLLLSRRGLRVPDDVSIVGFGGTRRNGPLARRLTSVTVDETRLGREAVDLLDRMRRGELPIESGETRDMPIGLHSGHTLRRLDAAPQARGETALALR